jgi:hypothetical protein
MNKTRINNNVKSKIAEGTEWLEFSPKEEFDKTMAVIMENFQKMAVEKPK